MLYKKIGTIQNGEYKYWNITIIEDIDETGGYYVLYWHPVDSSKGFDDWYEDCEVMKKNISENFTIKWTDENYIPRTPNKEEIKRAEEFKEMAKKSGF